MHVDDLTSAHSAGQFLYKQTFYELIIGKFNYFNYFGTLKRDPSSIAKNSFLSISKGELISSTVLVIKSAFIIVCH